jgi:hypothetical protein
VPLLSENWFSRVQKAEKLAMLKDALKAGVFVQVSFSVLVGVVE